MKVFKKLDMQKHLKETLHSSTIPVIGDPPSYLNCRIGTTVDIVCVDGKAYDKDAVAKLLAERDALLEKLVQKQQLISEMDQLCLTVGEVNEIRAEAVEDAANYLGSIITAPAGLYSGATGMILKYAKKIRQGGDV
jgi:hypothetical protein